MHQVSPVPTVLVVTVMEREKDVDVQFLRELREDFSFSPVVSEAIIHRAKLYYQGDGSQGYIGKLSVLAVSADEPAGKPIKHCNPSLTVE